MKKLALLTVLLLSAAAHSNTETGIVDRWMDAGGTSNVFSARGTETGGLSEREAIIPPTGGFGGVITFPYGVYQNVVVCAILQVCDIALQPGEVVNGINIGDSARWLVTPAVSGSGDNSITHVVLKPLEAGLETSLLILTNRRTYHLNLRSDKKIFMPRINFSYPEDFQAQLAAINAKSKAEARKEQQETLVTVDGGRSIKELDFNYELNGSAPWKPLRVYNDGLKTYIDIPAATGEVPVFFVLQDETPQIVNYRVLGGKRFVIDTVVQTGMLSAGVGNNAQIVKIERSQNDF